MARMRALWERTAANGLEREWLSAAELREREPNIIGLGGIFVPSSGIVSYRDVATAMANRFQAKGGEIIYHAEVSALTEHAAGIVIRTSQGREIETATLIGCAGLMADRLVKMLGVEPGFIICPFRGEYFRLAPRHNRIVNHLIYPIPDPAMPFLGVHLTRMIDGSVTVGPNAVLALKREGYRKRDVSFTDTLEIFRSAGIRRVLQNHLLSGLGEMKNSLCKSGYLRRVQKYCPSLTVNDLQPWPAGVGSQDWMKSALLAQKANVDPHKMRYVAFEGGGEPVTALMGNHVQVVSGDLSEMVPYLGGDKIRVLAVFSENRLPGQLANIPTAKEQGYDLVWPIIRGFYVGPKVSDADYQWWVDTFKKLQQTDEFKKQRDLRGLFEFDMTGQQLDDYVKKQGY